MTFKYVYHIVLCLILFILLVYNCCIPQVKNLVTKLFKYFLLIGFISSFADSICGVFISVHFSDNLFLSYLCIWINFASTHLIAPLYLMFVMALTNKYEKIPYREYLYFIPRVLHRYQIFFSCNSQRIHLLSGSQSKNAATVDLHFIILYDLWLDFGLVQG